MTVIEESRRTANEVEGTPGLDLSRTELTPVTQHYAPAGKGSGYPLLRSPMAVVVTRYDGQEKPIAEALGKRGWSVEACAGPGRSACPVLRGERCPLRESADAAVVFIDAREHQLGTVPRLRCAADSASPGVVALEGRLDGPRYEAGTAIVGAMRGPDAVVGAITALIGAASAAESEVDHG